MQRIFYLGMPKTGTKSFGSFLENLGYERQSHLWLPNVVIHNNWQEILRRIEKTGKCVFDDTPWHAFYRQINDRFPESKFVFHEREEMNWLDSYTMHEVDSLAKIFLQGKLNKAKRDVLSTIFGAPTIIGNVSKYLAAYREHSKQVRKFFAGSDRFLEVDLFHDPNVSSKICEFIGYKGKFPEQMVWNNKKQQRYQNSNYNPWVKLRNDAKNLFG